MNDKFLSVLLYDLKDSQNRLEFSSFTKFKILSPFDFLLIAQEKGQSLLTCSLFTAG